MRWDVASVPRGSAAMPSDDDAMVATISLHLSQSTQTTTRSTRRRAFAPQFSVRPYVGPRRHQPMILILLVVQSAQHHTSPPPPSPPMSDANDERRNKRVAPRIALIFS
ncbi:unnamed protein product [Heligmosomoides polygyrus]|uniref:Secreted protein n=1 Tax=Heligmosomoides polygyrus TaxID=6339 RepID=A0A183F2X7_HELPZ|nr:unnamed protein product [Heligmosomoides polygyrus]